MCCTELFGMTENATYKRVPSLIDVVNIIHIYGCYIYESGSLYSICVC